MHGQAPDPLSPATAAGGLLGVLHDVSWVDITALSVLLVFFVLGLFKGLVWQITRVVILVAAYAASARLGPPFAEVLLRWTHTGPDPPTQDQQHTTFYMACVLLFIGVLVLLSVLSLLLQKVIRKAGLGFYDRLFGGVVGVGSGAIVVLLLLSFVYILFPDSTVAAAANKSQSLRLSRQAVDLLGNVVPDEWRAVLPDPDADTRPAADPTTSEGQRPSDR